MFANVVKDIAEAVSRDNKEIDTAKNLLESLLSIQGDNNSAKNELSEITNQLWDELAEIMNQFESVEENGTLENWSTRLQILSAYISKLSSGIHAISTFQNKYRDFYRSKTLDALQLILYNLRSALRNLKKKRSFYELFAPEAINFKVNSKDPVESLIERLSYITEVCQGLAAFISTHWDFKVFSPSYTSDLSKTLLGEVNKCKSYGLSLIKPLEDVKNINPEKAGALADALDKFNLAVNYLEQSSQELLEVSNYQETLEPEVDELCDERGDLLFSVLSRSQEEQSQRNQKAIEWVRAQIQEDENMTEKEAQQSREEFEIFREIVDSNNALYPEDWK